MELLPRLNPEYGRDVAVARKNYDYAGLGIKLGKIGLTAATTVLGCPVTVPVGIGSAALLGLDALEKMREAERKR